jgi:tetratricopeptide (TPR) repeat protein
MSRSGLFLVVSGVALAVACVTTPPPPPPTPAPPPQQTELDGARLCKIVVDVDSAAAKNALGVYRLAKERGGDRHDVFAAALSHSKPEERFRAFHAETEKSPTSGLGPAGECVVYARWGMAKEATAACANARALLREDAAVVDAALVDVKAVDDAVGAVALADAALATAPKCGALLLARARALALAGKDDDAVDAYASAAAAADCFVCHVERARLLEKRAGPSAAASAWEDALKLAPDHADTLRRFAASVAGVDDGRALAAYEGALAAGAKDFGTVFAAAKLALQVAQTPTAVARALELATRAADLQKTDPEALRLVVDAALKKGDDAAALAAAEKLLALLPDDVWAHIAVARAALKAGKLETAVLHYDRAQAEFAAGRRGGVDDATAAAVTAERAGLLAQLMVDDSATLKGSASAVANVAQKGLQKLWKDRLKKKVVSSGGELTVVLETDASGAVVDVVVKDGAVKDSALRAAAIAWLHKAVINGGAKRYTLDLLLQ